MLTSDPALKWNPLACPGNRGSSHQADSINVISRGNNRKGSSALPVTILRSLKIVASQKSKPPFYLHAYSLRIEALLSVAQRMSGLSREELCSNSKRRGTEAVKEAVIVLGRRGGIRGRELAAALGLDPSALTRRMEAARSRGNRTLR
jgi:hypothetical protein